MLKIYFFLIFFISSSLHASSHLQHLTEHRSLTVSESEKKWAENFKIFFNTLLTKVPSNFDELLNIPSDIFINDKKFIQGIMDIEKSTNFEDTIKQCKKFDVAELPDFMRLKNNPSDKFEKEISIDIPDFMRLKADIFCRQKILSIIGTQIETSGKLENEIFSWIEKNMEFFVGGTNDNGFNNCLVIAKKKASKIYSKLTVLKKKFSPRIPQDYNQPREKVSKRVAIKKKLKKFFRIKHPVSFETLLMDDIAKLFVMPDNKSSNDEVELAIDNILKKIKSNHGKFSRKSVSTKMMNLGFLYSRRKFYSKARDLFNTSINLDESNKEKCVWGQLWSYIFPNDLPNAYLFVQQNKLNSEIYYKNPQIMFWTAYTLYKASEKNEAVSLWEKIINDYPISYYAIVSSKYLAKHSKKYANAFNKDWKEKSLADFKLSDMNPLITELLKRIKVWSAVDMNPYVNYLINDTANFKLTAEERENLFILTVHLLKNEEQRNYIQLFKMVYSAFEAKTINPSKDILEILYPLIYVDEISKSSKPLSIDPIILLSLIRQESVFNPKARSPVEATGLMQVMPATARTMRKGIRVSELEDPSTNIALGIEYFNKLYTKYNKNLVYVLGGYNAGPLRVDEWQTTSLHHDEMIFNVENIPFEETRKYVQLIYRNIFFYKWLYTKKKDPTDPNKVFDVNFYSSQDN